MGTLSEPPGHLSLSDSAAKSMVSAMIAVMLCSRTLPPSPARALSRVIVCGVRRSFTSELETFRADSAGSLSAAHLVDGEGRDWGHASKVKNGAPDALLTFTRSGRDVAGSAVSKVADAAPTQDLHSFILAPLPPPATCKIDHGSTVSGTRGRADRASPSPRSSSAHLCGSCVADSPLAATIDGPGSSGRIASRRELSAGALRMKRLRSSAPFRER